MSDVASRLPPALVDRWGRELGRSRRGAPTWTILARAAFCRELAAHRLSLAKALVAPYGGAAIEEADGTLTLHVERSGGPSRYTIEPGGALWQGGSVGGQHGLLGVASRLWRCDGDDAGPLTAADRFIAALGLAALRDGGGR